MLGVRNETLGSVHGLHSPQFRLDEAALSVGARLHAAFAEEWLAAAAAGGAPRQAGAPPAAAASSGSREEL